VARLLPLVCVLAALAAACTGDGGGAGAGAGAGTKATGRYGGIHTEVCRAAAQADDGDLDAARRTFDDVHTGLHELAAAAEEDDRATAARLLEAKQRVEARLSATSLRELVAPVAEAVVATGGTAPDTCP
jgi:hypothetical protein